MLVESIVCPPTPSYPYYIAAKRYFVDHGRESAGQLCDGQEKGLTLVFLHSMSFPKEMWEPIVEDLFKKCNGLSTRTVEAYAIDCPNHGVAAVLNDGLLINCTAGTMLFAQCVMQFLLNGPTLSTPVDFSKRNLVGIGHSFGAAAVVLMQAMCSSIKFKSIILVEPMTLTRTGEKLLAKLVSSASKRKDVWGDRKEAEAYFRKAAPGWHPRMLDMFLKYGLRDHPTHTHEVAPFSGVILACSRDQEAMMYREKDCSTARLKILDDICDQIPVHVIFGGISDYTPRSSQDELVDPKSGRNFASVTRIPDRGHLLPLQDPAALSTVLSQVIQPRVDTRPCVRARL